MPRIYNKHHRNAPPDAVYIGRPTKFGNPFSHLASGTLAVNRTASRDEAVDKYEDWIRQQPELLADIKKELAGRDLLCWCAPARCHGEVILRIANEDCTQTNS